MGEPADSKSEQQTQNKAFLEHYSTLIEPQFICNEETIIIIVIYLNS